MKIFTVFLLSLILLLGGVQATRAISTVPRSFDELVARADTVFRGTVTGQSARWVGEGEKRHIDTFVTFQVQETYKGTPAAEQTLRFLGGTVGDVTMAIPDMPQFETGQKAVLFVVNNGKQFCPLVGVAQGRFRVVTDAATGRERVWTEAGTPLVKTAEIGQADEVGRPRVKTEASAGASAISADDFRAEILSKVAAQAR